LIPSQSFVPKQTGEGFSPHVSTGVAPSDYLDKMLAEQFAPFTFSPLSAAIYQLGPFGTAAQKMEVEALKRMSEKSASLYDQGRTDRRHTNSQQCASLR